MGKCTQIQGLGVPATRLRLDLIASDSPFDSNHGHHVNSIAKDNLVSDFIRAPRRIEIAFSRDVATIAPDHIIVLLQQCCQIIKMRGSTQLGLFLPFRVSESLSKIHRLTTLFQSYITNKPLQNGLPWEEESRGTLERFRDGLQAAEISEVVAVLKWGISRVSYAPSTFATSSITVPIASTGPLHWFRPETFQTTLARLPSASCTILLELFSLVEVLVGQTDSNALTAVKLSKLLGYWIFGLAPFGTPATKYQLWQEASDVFFKSFQASLREQGNLPMRLKEVLSETRTRKITMLKIQMETEGSWNPLGRSRTPEELLQLASRLGMRDRRNLKTNQAKAKDEERAWEVILDAIADSQAGSEPIKIRRVIYSEEINRILDTIDDEVARLYLENHPISPTSITLANKPVIEPVPEPHWADFSSTGFDSISAPRYDPALGLINPSTAPSSRSPSLPLPPPVAISKFARLASTMRRKSDIKPPSTVPRRIPITKITSKTIVEIDADFVDFWLDSLSGPSLAPTDLLGPLGPHLASSILNSVTHLLVTEHYCEATPALASLSSTRSRSTKPSLHLLKPTNSRVNSKPTRSLSPTPLTVASLAPLIKNDEPINKEDKVTTTVTHPVPVLRNHFDTIPPLVVERKHHGETTGKAQSSKSKKGKGLFTWFSPQDSWPSATSQRSTQLPDVVVNSVKEHQLISIIPEADVIKQLLSKTPSTRRVQPPVFAEDSTVSMNGPITGLARAQLMVADGKDSGEESTTRSCVVVEREERVHGFVSSPTEYSPSDSPPSPPLVSKPYGSLALIIVPSPRLPRSQRFSMDGRWRAAPPSPTSSIPLSASVASATFADPTDREVAIPSKASIAMGTMMKESAWFGNSNPNLIDSESDYSRGSLVTTDDDVWENESDTDPLVDADPFVADATGEGSIYVPPSPSSRSLHSPSKRSLSSLQSQPSGPKLRHSQQSLSPASPAPIALPAAPAIHDSVGCTASFPALMSADRPESVYASPAEPSPSSDAAVPLAKNKVMLTKGFTSSRIDRKASGKVVLPKIVQNVKVRVDEIETIRALEGTSMHGPPSPTRKGGHTRNISSASPNTIQARGLEQGHLRQ